MTAAAAPLHFPDRTLLGPPRPHPAEPRALPPRPLPGARLQPTPCVRQYCCSFPPCWCSWLTVRDPGVRRQNGGEGGVLGMGREDRPWAQLCESGCPAQAPRSAGCAAPAPAEPAEPGGARAPRAGSRRGSRHSRLAKTSPLIISPDLMGFLCCNSSCHPLPARTLALTRALPLHTPGSLRAPGRVLGGRPQGGDSGRSFWLPAVPPSLPPAKLHSTLPPVPGPLVLTAERCGRLTAGPGVGTSLTFLYLGAATRETEPRAQFQRKSRRAWSPILRSSLCPELQ